MPKKILIADDTTFMRASIRKKLESAGYQIVGEATDGESVLSMYASLQPDLLILNILMPKQTGLQVLETIKQQAPHAIVLMCSAMGQASSVFSAIRSGASDFLVKPFTDRQLIEAVAMLIGVPEKYDYLPDEKGYSDPAAKAATEAPLIDENNPFAKLALEAEEALNNPTEPNS